MAEPKVTTGGVVLGKVTVARKHARRGQDAEKKSRQSIIMIPGKDSQVMSKQTDTVQVSNYI